MVVIMCLGANLARLPNKILRKPWYSDTLKHDTVIVLNINQVFPEYAQTMYFRKDEQEIEDITLKKGNRVAEGNISNNL